VSLRDCLYREKYLGGGLCHGHISHLVHLKTLLLDRLEHAKKRQKFFANTFSDALAILKFFLTADAGNFFSYLTNPTSGDKYQTSQLDKLT